MSIKPAVHPERSAPHVRRLTRDPVLLVAGMALLAGACGDDDTTQPVACTDDVTEVDATIRTGADVVFDWSPSCAVALLLVEEGASDRWSIGAPDGESNVVIPPVTYGAVPAGAEETNPAVPLQPGVTYELVLWRLDPATGAERLLTVQEFTP